MASKFKWALAAVMVSILVVGIIGCGGDDGEGNNGKTEAKSVSGITKEEMVNRIVAAEKGIETAHFEMDAKVLMKGEEDGEKIDGTISMKMTGTMDTPGKKMHGTVDIEMPQGALEEGMPERITMEIYMVADTMYMNMGGLGEMAGLPGQWMKISMEEKLGMDLWQSYDLAKQMRLQTDLLREAVDYEITGEATINGIDCYEITIKDIDYGKLIEMMGQSMGGLLPEEAIDSSKMTEAAEMLEDMFKDFDVKQWYGKENFFPVKIDMEMEIEIEEDGDEMSMQMEIEMKFLSHNQPVSIELPSEAANAIEMPTGEFE